MIYEIIAIVLTAIWTMLPAYIPNSFAAIFGGGRMIDGGKVMKDGRRILGDGKTYGGLFSGILAGFLLGILQTYIVVSGFNIFGIEFVLFELNPPENAIGFGAIVTILSLATGSLLGDMSMSFVKRRIGLKRGASLPLVDQYDFLLGALILTAITSWDWMVQTINLKILIGIIVVTPILHISANIIAYKMKVKDEPW